MTGNWVDAELPMARNIASRISWIELGEAPPLSEELPLNRVCIPFMKLDDVQRIFPAF